MDKVVNVEILGRPLNALILICLIVVFWYSLYMTFGGKVAALLPSRAA